MEVMMSHSNKKKNEFKISIKETVEKLRTLANELDREVITINEEECSIAPDSQVKISLKAKDDKLSTKLKFKLATPFVGSEVTPLVVKGEEEENDDEIKSEDNTPTT